MEKKHPIVIDSWQRNWEKLSTYFKHPEAIRKLVYTTNTIEGYRQIRKVTKNQRRIHFRYGTAKTH
jgi:putative transposase